MRSPHTTTKSSPCSLQLEKACTQQRRPNAAKTKTKRNQKKLLAPNEGGPGSIPGQGTRSRMQATTKDPTRRDEDPARGNEDPTCCN